MPELLPEPPLAGASARHGDCTLAAMAAAPLYWLAPYPGQTAACDAALQAAFGLALPPPGTTAVSGAVELRWAGRAQALLIGPARPPQALAPHGAVTEVSDVYARLLLAGAAAPAVLARLMPLDLRPERFPPGRTARSLLGHVAAQVTAGDAALEVMVMRSFAKTAFHEIEAAMARVAARAALP